MEISDKEFDFNKIFKEISDLIIYFFEFNGSNNSSNFFLISIFNDFESKTDKVSFRTIVEYKLAILSKSKIEDLLNETESINKIFESKDEFTKWKNLLKKNLFEKNEEILWDFNDIKNSENMEKNKLQMQYFEILKDLNYLLQDVPDVIENYKDEYIDLIKSKIKEIYFEDYIDDLYSIIDQTTINKKIGFIKDGFADFEKMKKILLVIAKHQVKNYNPSAKYELTSFDWDKKSIQNQMMVI